MFKNTETHPNKKALSERQAEELAKIMASLSVATPAPALASPQTTKSLPAEKSLPAASTAPATSSIPKASTASAASSIPKASTAKQNNANTASAPSLQNFIIQSPAGNFQASGFGTVEELMNMFAPFIPQMMNTRTRFQHQERMDLQTLTAQSLKEMGDHYLNEHGNPNNAIRYYNDAIAEDINFKEAYIQRGNAYLQLKQFNKAIADANAVLKLDTNNFDAVLLLASGYIFSDKHVEALPITERLIELRPDFVDGYSGHMSCTLEIYKTTKTFDAKKILRDCNKMIEHGAAVDIILAEVVKEKLEFLKTNPSPNKIKAIFDEVSTRANERHTSFRVSQ